MDHFYKNFKTFWPSLAKKTVKHCNGTRYGVYARTDTGESYLYNDMDNSARPLPRDANRMTEEECRNEFGKRLYWLMTIKGVTQADLSERTGISRIAISNYINSRYTPSFYNADKIAKALDCSLDELRYTEW